MLVCQDLDRHATTKVLRPVAVPIIHLHTNKDVGQTVLPPTNLSDPAFLHNFLVSRFVTTFHAHILSDISRPTDVDAI